MEKDLTDDVNQLVKTVRKNALSHNSVQYLTTLDDSQRLTNQINKLMKKEKAIKAQLPSESSSLPSSTTSVQEWKNKRKEELENELKDVLRRKKNLQKQLNRVNAVLKVVANDITNKGFELPEEEQSETVTLITSSSVRARTTLVPEVKDEQQPLEKNVEIEVAISTDLNLAESAIPGIPIVNQLQAEENEQVIDKTSTLETHVEEDMSDEKNGEETPVEATAIEGKKDQVDDNGQKESEITGTHEYSIVKHTEVILQLEDDATEEDEKEGTNQEQQQGKTVATVLEHF